MFPSSDNKDKAFWFVLRDLKRSNAKQRAHQLFAEQNIEVFTPMKWRKDTVNGKQVLKEVPCIPDLLFVHDSRMNLDPIIEKNKTIQYRWMRNKYREPMVVSDTEMEQFIRVVRTSGAQKIYLPEEITPEMKKRHIRIVGGPLDGCEGTLITIRGSKIKRLLVELSGLLGVGVEVTSDYILFL